MTIKRAIRDLVENYVLNTLNWNYYNIIQYYLTYFFLVASSRLIGLKKTFTEIIKTITIFKTLITIKKLIVVCLVFGAKNRLNFN